MHRYRRPVATGSPNAQMCYRGAGWPGTGSLRALREIKRGVIPIVRNILDRELEAKRTHRISHGKYRAPAAWRQPLRNVLKPRARKDVQG